MEVSRYIKGIYGYPFKKNSDSNIHSINAYKVLDKFLIGKFEVPNNANSWILVDSFNNRPAYSNCELWQKVDQHEIADGLNVYFFKNENYFVNLNLYGVDWIGQSFMITNDWKSRIYSICLSLTKESILYRNS